MQSTTASLLIPCLALMGVAAGAGPSAAQSPAPAITINDPAATEAPPSGEPAGAAESPAPAAKAAAIPAKKKNTEVLPWANKPLAAAPPTGDTAASDAAAAQCGGLFEAACRDLKTCAWIAPIALQDGSQAEARCVARRPAPPKNAAKKTPAKAAAKAVEGAAGGDAAAPAVKESVTRVEDEAPAAAPKAEKKKAVVTHEPAAPEPDAQAAASEKAEQAEKKVEAAKAPIVVKPPPPAEDTPSFGSVSPIMPGGGDAVVVTVPPKP